MSSRVTEKTNEHKYCNGQLFNNKKYFIEHWKKNYEKYQRISTGFFFRFESLYFSLLFGKVRRIAFLCKCHDHVKKLGDGKYLIFGKVVQIRVSCEDLFDCRSCLSSCKDECDCLRERTTSTTTQKESKICQIKALSLLTCLLSFET